MFGQPSGPEVSVKLDNPDKCFTQGDSLTGTLVVNSGKPFSVQSIQIKLRCEEYAKVWVNAYQNGHYGIESVRHLALENTLFPTTQMRSSSQSTPAYTLPAGEHEYPFQVTIPIDDKSPETVYVEGSDSKIKWYVKGSVHRGEVLSLTKRDYQLFEMRPTSDLPRGYSQDMTTSTAEIHMWAFMPGYAAWVATSSGKWKCLIPGNTHYRKKAGVQLSMGVPSSGLLQDPHPIKVQTNLSCDDEELLLVRRVEFKLKQKIAVSLRKEYAKYTDRKAYDLLTLDSLDWPFKITTHELQERMNNIRITGRLPGTFDTRHFWIEYKLVLVLTVTSREKPKAAEKLRISVPVRLNSFNPKDLDQAAPAMLPTYQQVSGAGEFKPPIEKGGALSVDKKSPPKDTPKYEETEGH